MGEKITPKKSLEQKIDKEIRILSCLHPEDTVQFQKYVGLLTKHADEYKIKFGRCYKNEDKY